MPAGHLVLSPVGGRGEGEELSKLMSAGHEVGMAVPLLPAFKKENSKERSLAL